MRLNAAEALEKLKEDRDVVEPFLYRLVQRLQERTGDLSIRLSDIEITIEVARLSPSEKVIRMMDEMHQ